MKPAPIDQAVFDALIGAQRLGFLGDRPIGQVIEHARAFVDALDVAAVDDASVITVLDLGAGGGVPGLVIAMDRPHMRVTLLDRRAKRTDALERVVSRLGWAERVSVACVDADTYRPAHPFDAVVARGFGPPDVTLATGTRLVREGGYIVISEPPAGDRWDTEHVERLGVDRLSGAGAPVVVFRRR